MGQFTGAIDLEALPDGYHWKVINDFFYTTDAGEKLDIPAGLITDLASTPRIIWNILPPFGRYTGAAIVHDDLYATQKFTRERSDAILLEAMEAEGVSWLTRYTIYWGVRIGGWAAWNEDATKYAQQSYVKGGTTWQNQQIPPNRQASS